MTLLKAKPPDERPLPHQKTLVSPLFINGRRYLDPSQPKSTDHIPMCRAVSAIEFRDVERYICTADDSKTEIREKLKIACEEARRSYQRIREQKSLLTESFAVMEVVANAKSAVSTYLFQFKTRLTLTKTRRQSKEHSRSRTLSFPPPQILLTTQPKHPTVLPQRRHNRTIRPLQLPLIQLQLQPRLPTRPNILPRRHPLQRQPRRSISVRSTLVSLL